MAESFFPKRFRPEDAPSSRETLLFFREILMSDVLPQADLIELIGEEAARRVVAIRHDLHQHPEIGMETHRTAGIAEAAMRRLGLEDIRRFAKTGVVGRLRGEAPGPMIGLRADMDALTVQEETGAPWQSLVPKCAHLCGHDGHTAGLIAAMEYFAQHRDFAGELVFIFQPGEEGWSGAKHMMDDGLFEAFPVSEVYAIHDHGLAPLGRMQLRKGAMNASVDLATFTVEGRGGHGARPHQAIDPVPVAAQLILSLQTIVSRNVNPTDAAVISVCWLEAGDVLSPTVIPQCVRLSAAIRTHDAGVRDLIEKRVKEVVEGLSIQTNTRVTVNYDRKYPAQINDAALVDALVPSLQETFGEAMVLTDFVPGMGSEDFAYMTEKVPGVYIQLGVDDETHHAGLHNPSFDFNDKVLGTWVRVFATIVKNRLPPRP